jgi:hypothetical protein
MSYPTLKKFVLSSLALYFVIGVCVNYLTPTREVYPFFSWNLFSGIPNVGHETVLEILLYEGTEYDPPLQAAENAFVFQYAHQTPNYYRPLITDLGNAIKSHDAPRIADDRKKLERVFPPSPVRYRIVEITYDPLERWNTGALRSRNILGEFTTDI